MNIRKTTITAVCFFSAVLLYGQETVTDARLAISTNIFDWGWFLTPNVEVQYALGQHWTAVADIKYNRWTFNDDSSENRTRHARQEYAIGMKWWGWYTFSGWWLGVRAQYREYSGCGLSVLSRDNWRDPYVKEEGDALGAALSFGYSVQVTRWLNFDFGLGVWGGYALYRQYSGETTGGKVCPRYGRRTDGDMDAPPSGTFFIGPNEVMVTAVFVF